MSEPKGSGPWWRVPRRWWLLGIPLGGWLFLVLGAVALVATAGVLEYTNRNEFCYGCHVGRDTVVEEYHDSIHFSNRSGVQASCADCHVPKELIPKLKVKIIAISDIYHQITGKINLENFESHRLRQAEHVWHELKETDSRTCRSCHNALFFDREEQPTRARTHHDPRRWEARGETCIDCHTGVAHKRPEATRSTYQESSG